MDELSKARRKWKRAEGVVEEAQARLRAAGGGHGKDASGQSSQPRRQLEEAVEAERRARNKYRRIKSQKGE
jgi:hypothetical protein